PTVGLITQTGHPLKINFLGQVIVVLTAGRPVGVDLIGRDQTGLRDAFTSNSVEIFKRNGVFDVLASNVTIVTLDKTIFELIFQGAVGQLHRIEVDVVLDPAVVEQVVVVVKIGFNRP